MTSITESTMKAVKTAQAKERDSLPESPMQKHLKACRIGEDAKPKKAKAKKKSSK